jgi:hypothetical protein
MADPNPPDVPDYASPFEPFRRGQNGEPEPSPREGTRQPESGPSTPPLPNPRKPGELERGYPGVFDDRGGR